MKIIENPGLPQGIVTLVAIGHYPPVIAALKALGVETLVINENPLLDEPIRHHADLNCLHMPCGYLLSRDFSVHGFEHIVPAGDIGVKYPHDCALNCLILGNRLICNSKYCAPEVLALAESMNMKIIHVNQGYARCSVAVIDESSIITADEGIIKALRGENIDVLKINQDMVSLSGYANGFIGGCCSKLSKNMLMFSGFIDVLPDYKRIIEFIEERHIEIVYATKERVFDFGGFIPLIEDE